MKRMQDEWKCTAHEKEMREEEKEAEGIVGKA